MNDEGGSNDDDETSDRDPFKATRTYLEINQKLERLWVNDVDKTANDRSVFRIKLNVQRAGHFSFKILGACLRRNDDLHLPCSSTPTITTAVRRTDKKKEKTTYNRAPSIPFPRP